MKSLLILFILSMFVTFPNSHAMDVFGTDSNTIQILESKDKTQVGFRLCSLKDEFKCKRIGKKSYYSKQKLNELRNSEQWDILSAIGADILIIAGTAATGGGLAYAGTASGATATTIYGTLAGVAGGGSIAIIATMTIDAINPYEQYMQIQTLNGEVIDDQRVDLDYDVMTFAKRLAAILNNI